PEPVEGVGRQQLGLAVDHTCEQGVGSQGAGDTAGVADQAGADRLPRPVVLRTLLLVQEDRAQLAGEQVGHERGHVGPAPVDGGPTDPGTPGDVGEGGPANPEGFHAGPGRVEDVVFYVTL